MSDPFDYLFLEPLLIERIRSEVPGLAIVSGVPDLAALSEQDQPAPSVYVVYLGDEIGTGADHQGGQARHSGYRPAMGGCAGGALRRLVELRRRSAPRGRTAAGTAGQGTDRMGSGHRCGSVGAQRPTVSCHLRQRLLLFPPGVHRQVRLPEGQVMETVKVTITAENPNHTHAGKPVAKGDEIEVSRADAEFLLRRQLITKIPAEPKADEKRDK
ncbi:hypothetical protein [Pseudomonas aeruginosa]|nr:hypothetical protein [Pseudomonas aeruginosa]